MAGMWQRFKMIFKSKANAAMDKAENPAQTLDYSYEKQLEMLQKVRRGVADVATSRKRVELQIAGLDKQLGKLDDQARAALASGREDLAREALTRKSGVGQQLNDLHAQLLQLTEQEQKLTAASQQLQAKVESFRTQKETIKASYSAAEAQVRINEAFTGISNELGDVGLAIQRAEDRTAQMQARAGAMEELMATGALEVPGGKDSLTAELERIAADSAVENDLAALKAELAGGAPPAAVTGAPAAVPAVEAGPSADRAAAAPGEVVDAVIADEAPPAAAPPAAAPPPAPAAQPVDPVEPPRP
jgi:phage shock protein A